MGKQYSFRSTKDTQWIEQILNNMDRLKRAEFMRDAVVEKLLNSSQDVTHVKHESQKVVTHVTPKVTHVTHEDEPSLDDLFTEGKEEELDLDSISFDNLDIGGMDNDI